MVTLPQQPVPVAQSLIGANTRAGTVLRAVLLAVPVAVAATAVVVATVNVQASYYLLAFALGWTVLVGPCGCAHVGALSSLACQPRRRIRWLAAISAYSLGGVVAGALTGATVAFFGLLLDAPKLGILLAIAVCGLCLLRETRMLPIPLLERRRQTRSRWIPKAPIVVNAALWGADVGLVFATWITFSGAWLLAAVILTGGSIAQGATVFAVYWVGRAAPHWIEPLALKNGPTPMGLSQMVRRMDPEMRRAHVVALVAFAIILAQQF